MLNDKFPIQTQRFGCSRPRCESVPEIPGQSAARRLNQSLFFLDAGGGGFEFSLTTAIISSIPSLISLTWGCTSLMRSCSILDSFSMRLPWSRSWSKRKFCLMESRRIHQKQTPQQTVPASVIQKERLLLFIVSIYWSDVIPFLILNLILILISFSFIWSKQ